MTNESQGESQRVSFKVMLLRSSKELDTRSRAVTCLVVIVSPLSVCTSMGGMLSVIK